MADPDRVEAIWDRFSVLFAPPRVPLEYSRLMEWNGVGAIFLTAYAGARRSTDVFRRTVGIRSTFRPLGATVPGGLSGGRNLVHTGWARRSRGRPWPCGGRFSLSFDTLCPAPAPAESLLNRGVGRCGRNIGRREGWRAQHGRLRTHCGHTERFCPAGRLWWGAVRPGAICSILGEQVAVVAAHASMEVILGCFPTLFAPPRVPSSISI